MIVMYKINQESARYDGYVDLNGQFIPFEMADEVFTRARSVGARPLPPNRKDRHDRPPARAACPERDGEAHADEPRRTGASEARRGADLARDQRQFDQ